MRVNELPAQIEPLFTVIVGNPLTVILSVCVEPVPQALKAVRLKTPLALGVTEIVFVTLTTDENGYAKISSVSKEMPMDQQDYVKAKVSNVTNMENEDNYLTITYPFDRFYMEESKASDAERLYLESLRDTNLITYGLVNIKAVEAEEFIS
jgi:hypothetical protein